MTLYTAKAIATVLDMTERNVRKLRAKGVIREAKPGLYELVPTVNAYINYLRGADAQEDTYTEQRARLTKAKAEAAELENGLRKNDLHETGEIEKALTVLVANLRTRMLALPAKLTPNIVQLEGDKNKVFDLLQGSIEEALEEMSHYENAFALPEGDKGGTNGTNAGRSGAVRGNAKGEKKTKKAAARKPKQAGKAEDVQ